MSHIKEPEGVDFLIQSPPLTEQERREISEQIRKMKAKPIRKKSTKETINKKETVE